MAEFVERPATPRRRRATTPRPATIICAQPITTTAASGWSRRATRSSACTNEPPLRARRPQAPVSQCRVCRRPYKGKSLPAYFMKSPYAKGPAPTMVLFDGLDNCKEMSVLSPAWSLRSADITRWRSTARARARRCGCEYSGAL